MTAEIRYRVETIPVSEKQREIWNLPVANAEWPFLWMVVEDEVEMIHEEIIACFTSPRAANAFKRRWNL